MVQLELLDQVEVQVAQVVPVEELQVVPVAQVVLHQALLVVMLADQVAQVDLRLLLQVHQVAEQEQHQLVLEVYLNIYQRIQGLHLTVPVVVVADRQLQVEAEVAVAELLPIHQAVEVAQVVHQLAE